MKRRFRAYGVALGFFMLIGGTVGARDLSLGRVLELAQEQSFVLKASKAEADAAGQASRLAGAEALPKLSASGSFGAFQGDVLFGRFVPGAPGDGVTDIGPYDGNQVLSLELKQVLYAGGGITAAQNLGRLEAELADVGLERSRRDVVSQAREAFYGVLFAQRRIDAAHRSVERSAAGLETITQRYAEQEALRVELLGAEGQLAADRLELLEAEHDLELARRALNRLLGREERAPLVLSGSLEDGAVVPDEKAGIERALTADTGIRASKFQVALADVGLARAKALSRPKVELGLQYSRIDNELFFDGEYAGAVVNLSIPFMSDFRAGSAARAQAQAGVERADAVHAEIVSTVRLGTVAAYRHLEAAKVGVGVAEKNLEYHRERYRVTLSAYREQIVTYSDVLDRHDDLSRAELALDAAHFEVRRAEAEILMTIG